jgi:hypothetical protein
MFLVTIGAMAHARWTPVLTGISMASVVFVGKDIEQKTIPQSLIFNADKEK